MRDSYQEDVIVYQIANNSRRDYPIVTQEEVDKMAFSTREESRKFLAKSRSELDRILKEKEVVRILEETEVVSLHQIKTEQEMTEETVSHLLSALNQAMSLKAEKMFKVNDVSETIGKSLLAIEGLPEKFGE